MGGIFALVFSAIFLVIFFVLMRLFGAWMFRINDVISELRMINTRLNKLTLLLMLLASSSICLSQKVITNGEYNGYKYVYVPTLDYGKGIYDKCEVSSITRNFFRDKGFIVINKND